MKTVAKQNQFAIQQINENHKTYLERIAFYKGLGFDHIQARNNVIKQIGSTSYKNILEVGTGKGYLSTILAKKYGFVVSLDINQEDQEMALMTAIHANIQNKIDFVLQNCEELNYKAQSFDVVVSVFTFHHLDKPFQVINEMLKVFKHKLIISDFNSNGKKIIERAHALENKKHRYANEQFEVLPYFLKEKGFALTEIEDDWQKILIIERR
jgi:ubiquinone/menaquinone biosynthesis C-methylase UbiE